MGSQKILLVEDEIILALAKAGVIKRLGYEVAIAHTGENAVMQALDDSAIGLILMDINLGKGIDGTETARRILSTRFIPIVFLTSHSEFLFFFVNIRTERSRSLIT
jgi:CheY-like chemotaxis protein